MELPTDITQKNIRSIHEREREELRNAPFRLKVTKRIADFSGTVAFAICNALFFAFWIIGNVFFFKFDPYPFIFLTLVVSLEAIFLSVFVLISQNTLSKQAEARNMLDLQVNILTEQTTTAQSRVILEIAKKMGVDKEKLKELESLSDDTNPEDVLEQISEEEKKK